MDDGSNESDQCYYNGCVVYLEENGEPFGPAPVGMGSADDSLSEYQVDDEEEEDASSHEDVCCDGKTDIVLSGSPGDTKD